MFISLPARLISMSSNVCRVFGLLRMTGNFGSACHCAGRYFTSDPPARACFAVKSLPLDAKVEIEAIAAL